MFTAVHAPERHLSKLSRTLSKLSLKTEERRRQLNTQKKNTSDPRGGPWDIPIPRELSKKRARDYIRSVSISDGRPFIPQYSEIIPGHLFISDRYTGTEPAVLSRLRITHVARIVNTSTQIDPSVAQIQYHDMVVPNDLYKADFLLGRIDDTVDFVDNALREGKARVLIYCATGVAWSPSITIAWLMRNENCTYEVAKEFVKRKREVVNPSLEVERAVQEWWAFEVARLLFPPGRGGRDHNHRAFAPQIAVDLYEDSFEDVIDIR